MIRIPAFIKKQSISQAALTIAIISLISKLFGFLREILIAKYFGATGQTDAFLVALMIPSLLLGLFSAGFNTLIIPFYLEKKLQGERAIFRFVNSNLIVWGTIFIFLSIVIFVFAPYCVRIVAFGFKDDTFNLAVTLTRYLIISGFFTVFVGIFTGLFQAEKQFFLPILSTFLGNIGLVLILFLMHGYLGIHSWTLGQTFNSSFAFFIMLFVLYRRYNFFKSLNFSQIDWVEIKQFGLLLVPLIISGGLSMLNQTIDKIIASSLEAGSIAAINFATRIWQIPITLWVVPIATAIFPTFSELAINDNFKKEYEYKLQQTLSYMLFLTIPSTLFLYFLSRPITRLFFERGAFDSHATDLTSYVLKMYIIGLFAHATSPIMAKAFYSFKNTKTPLIISIICITFNIALNIILSRIIGVAGIALATSIVMVTSVFLYSRFLKRYLIIFQSGLRSEILKIIICSFPVGIVSYFSLPYLDDVSAVSISGFISLATRITVVGILSSIPFITICELFRLKSYLFIKSYFINQIERIINKKNEDI